MKVSILEVSAIAFTYLFFGWLGIEISKKLRAPVSIGTWIALVLLTFVVTGFLLGPGGLLVQIIGFNIYVNSAFQAIGVGIIIGLATRELRRKVEGDDLT